MSKESNDPNAITRALSRNVFFEQLTPQELEQISRISSLNDYQTDDLVFTESQPAHYLFLVAEGGLELTLKNNEPKAFLPGDVFGEIGILNNSVRSGSVRATSPSSVVAICGTRMFNEAFIDPSLALKLTRALAKKITDYLISREQFGTRDIINEGEGDFVEFKSTLRMNLRSGKKDKNMEMAVLKTIAAFLNTKGGTLLIGVTDDGQVSGIEADNFANQDKFLLHLTNLVKDKIGSLQLDYLHFEIHPFETGTVTRVDCEASDRPAYVIDGDDEYLFIRTGPSTTKLRLSKVFDFVSRHFPLTN